ncbi:hypothetical protein NIASO_11270 [Niabella soli DSM 19437]|uniref:Uncharacterized protein n=1 Tax=Niabella soli DSM 19437 TaxID=929713 RepID=W0F8C2_9BACT|nr:hypothetical protein NIASO_11270 [Niabella soli DSM 19437]
MFSNVFLNGESAVLNSFNSLTITQRIAKRNNFDYKNRMKLRFLSFFLQNLCKKLALPANIPPRKTYYIYKNYH